MDKSIILNKGIKAIQNNNIDKLDKMVSLLYQDLYTEYRFGYHESKDYDNTFIKAAVDNNNKGICFYLSSEYAYRNIIYMSNKHMFVIMTRANLVLRAAETNNNYMFKFGVEYDESFHHKFPGYDYTQNILILMLKHSIRNNNKEILTILLSKDYVLHWGNLTIIKILNEVGDYDGMILNRLKIINIDLYNQIILDQI